LDSIGQGQTDDHLSKTQEANAMNGAATCTDLGVGRRRSNYVLRSHTGPSTATASEVTSLSIAPPFSRVDMLDCLRIARKVAGLEANP
jgi:hypothetical protein